MPRLASLFVPVKGDDRDLNKTAARVKNTLRGLDRQKVEPKIRLPEVTAEIAAIEKRLEQLGKKKVELGVDASAADGEIRSLEERLDGLKDQKVTVTAELAGDLDEEIKSVNEEIDKLRRKKAHIPVDLGGIAGQVSSLQSRLATLRADGADIPVNLTGLARARARLTAFVKTAPPVDLRIRPIAAGGTGDFNPLKLLAIPALLGALHVSASAVASLTAGATALVGALAPVGGSVVALGQAYGALGLGTAAVRTQFMGVGDAMKVLKVEVDAARAGVKLTETQQRNLNVELEAAGPAAAGFAREMLSLLGRFGEMRKRLQNSFLPEFGNLLEAVAVVYLPIVEEALRKTSDQVLSLSRLFASALRTPRAITDISIAIEGATQLLGTMGRLLVPLGGVIADVWIAAIPMSAAFADSLLRGITRLSELTAAARDSGALTNFFMLAYDTTMQFLRILGQLGIGLYNVFSGGAESGRDFLDTFDRLTKKFADWSSSVAGETAISDFFDRARPALHEIGLLVGDIVKGFGALAANTDAAPIIAQIRTQLLPALGSLIASVNESLLPALIELATAAIAFYEVLAESGALVAVAEVFSGFAKTLLWVTTNVPGATHALEVLFALFAVRSVVGVLSMVTGLRGLVGAALGLNVATGPLATALLSVATASGRATIATRLQAAASRLGIMWTGLATAAQWLWNTALKATGKAIYGALGPVGLIIAGIALLVAGVIYAYRNFGWFRDIVNTVGRALKAGFLAAVDAVGKAVTWLGSVWAAVAPSVAAAWEAIKTAVATGWSAVVGFFSSAGSAIVTPLRNAWTAISTTATEAFTTLRTVVGNALVAIGTFIASAVNTWLMPFRIFATVILTLIIVAWGAVYALFMKVMKQIRDDTRGWWTAIKNDAIAAWNAVLDGVILPIWRAISGVWTRFTGAVKETWTRFWDSVKATAWVLWNSVKTSVIDPVWNGIKRAWLAASNWVTAKWNNFWTVVKGAASIAWTTLQTNLSNGWAALKALWTLAQAYVRERWDRFWFNIRTAGQVVFKLIRERISTDWNLVKDIFRVALDVLRIRWTNWWNKTKSTVTDAMRNVKDNIDYWMGRITGATKSFVSSIGRLWGGIKDAFSRPWDWVKRNVFDKIASVYNKVAKITGAPTINLSDGGRPAGSGGGGGGVSSGQMTPARADGGRIPAPRRMANAVRRAAGGVIRGVGGPREDNIMGIDRNTKLQTSWVSAKEFVVNAKSYAANKGLVESINSAKGRLFDKVRPTAADRQPMMAFANGGEVPRLAFGGASVHPGPWSSHGSNYYGARVAGDYGSGYGGTPAIKAWKDGVVAAVQYLKTSYGHNVRINHGGEWTRYAHMSTIGVDAGDKVRAGQTIGRGGWTGNVRPRGPGGAHLHFEIHGGSAATNNGKGTGDSSDPGGVLQMINPREMFRKGAGKILDTVGKGLSVLGVGGGDTPLTNMIGRLPRTVVNMLANKLPESFGVPTLGGAFSKLAAGTMNALGRGRGPIKNAMLRLGASSVGTYPGHQPSMLRAWDAMINNKATGDRIAGHLAANRGKYGIDYLIWNRRMLRSYDKGNIKAGTWGPYFDGNSSNPNRAHTNHVHASFADGGFVGQLAEGGIVRGGRGGVTSQLGEGRFDELVTPLPPNWQRDSGGDIKRLIALIEERGLTGPSFSFTTHNPIAETESQTMNSSLQRLANLDLV